jgi:hypothetical protein
MKFVLGSRVMDAEVGAIAARFSSRKLPFHGNKV